MKLVIKFDIVLRNVLGSWHLIGSGGMQWGRGVDLMSGWKWAVDCVVGFL